MTAISGFVNRLRGDGTYESRRMREVLVAIALVVVTGYLGLGITDKYPTVLVAVVGAFVLLLMIENQERTLYLLLWFSTIYALLKATVLGWSNLAFLFKEGFLALLITFWIFHFLLRQEKFPDTVINKPMLVLLAWLLMQCFNPNNFGMIAVIDDLRHWLGQIAIFFLTVYLVNDERKLERGLGFVFGYAVLAMLYGIAQQFMPGDLLVKLGADPNSYFYFFEGTIRSFSTMGTVPFALFASLFPCIAFFYASQQGNSLHRFVFTVLGFLFVLAVLLTLVRTSWVATIVGVVVYAALGRRWGLLALILVLVLLVGTFASGYMRAKVQGLLNPTEDPSIQTRLLIAKIVSEAVVFRAFGYGLGTFAHSKYGIDQAGKVGYTTQTENWYLMVSLELGWVGVLLLAWIWYKVYRLAWYGYRGGFRTPRYQQLALALAGALFTMEVSRLGGPSGYYPPDSWHYWFFAGLLMGLPRIDAERVAREQAEAAGRPAGVAPAAATRAVVSGG